MTAVAVPGKTGTRTGIVPAATMPVADLLVELEVDSDAGLAGAEVTRRQGRYGPNAVSYHPVRSWPVIWHQLRSPLLGLLLAAVVASYLVGERASAVMIAVIVCLSGGLGFVNEVRAEKAAEAQTSRPDRTTRRRTCIRAEPPPRHYELATDVPPPLRLAAAFSEFALAI